MKTNRLIHEKSPYLLQHAHNPVDWYAWSDEAFSRAREEDKPVFVSIGYATCHWCHVMEKESFENDEVARHLNDTFISIKVDREERPDIDAVYMAACQMMTGSGGWPLNVFMTPDKRPFFAATYIPRESRFGRAGLIDLSRQVKNLWAHERGRVRESVDSIAGHLGKAFAFTSADDLDQSVLDDAYARIQDSFDEAYAGFGPAPKFPSPHRLLFLLRHHHRTQDPQALEMVRRTLVAMRLGGIWDHVGFGFHRYSTDRQWVLPHFEKMLYDQALLAMACLETYQVTGDRFLAATAEEIFEYVLRHMTGADGAFWAAEDADSEGEEGKFYVWSTAEFRNVLGVEEAARWEALFNLQSEGNFADEASGRRTGANILYLNRPLAQSAEALNKEPAALLSDWAATRSKLFQAREARVHPLKDDKVLTDWNGLMIAALAMGARVLGRRAYADAAQKAVRFILTHLQADNGALLHRFREGEAGIDAHADDYAFFIWGLLELYGATFDPDCLEHAATLQERMLADFWDPAQGGFYLTATGSDELPVRPKEIYDGAMPSANSVALLNLLQLARLTGKTAWETRAQELIRAFAGTVKSQPTAFTHFLLGVDFALHPGEEVVITGEAHSPAVKEMLHVLNRSFAPHRVALFKSRENAEQLSQIAGFTSELNPVEGKSTAHVCRNFACTEVATDAPGMLERLLARKADPES